MKTGEYCGPKQHVKVCNTAKKITNNISDSTVSTWCVQGMKNEGRLVRHELHGPNMVE